MWLEGRKKDFRAHPEKLFPKEWQKGINVKIALSLALRSLNQNLKITYRGWKFNQARIYFRKKDKMLSSIIEITYSQSTLSNYQSLPKEVVISSDAKTIKVVNKLEEIQVEDGEWEFKDLQTQKELQRIFLDLTQIFKCKTNLKFEPQRISQVPDLGAFNCPWSQGQFKIEAIRLTQIESLHRFLEKIPGLNLEELERDKSTYRLIGKVYGRI